ncbi:unnamed protein product [Thelazia callipaeda]|uniref:Neur_chan_memb domain-containing protein n=1 Tax=Thelazia callipaeda TaxID=103827 RepID=A0A0N5D5Y5_THECL|nr:unnamed protein product [Thelazia callipaeda]
MLWIDVKTEADSTWEYLVYKFEQYVIMLTCVMAYISMVILKYYRTPSENSAIGVKESEFDHTIVKDFIGTNLSTTEHTCAMAESKTKIAPRM